MVLKAFIKKNENLLFTLAGLMLLGLFAGLRYDYYFDLNDDVLMKDILAGVYTGTPEGHNIQMLWPVSAFISLLYRIAPALPCYGLFLCACQYGSMGLVMHRSLGFCKTVWGKGLLVVTEVVLVAGLLLTPLVSVQYTITCTMLASSAAFLFFTTDITLPAKAFIKKNIGTVLLAVLAFLIRSEMLLLVTPLICVAGVIKWGSEKVFFTKEHAVKYLTVIASILAGLLLSQLCHNLAYGSIEWKQFTEYFDNRTELYDFQVLPEYESHQAFYESIGLSESERDLLDNYNFGLSEEIDEDIVGQVAAYAAENRSAERPLGERLKTALGAYYRRTVYGPSHNESDFPWNRMIIVSYLAVFAVALADKEKKFLPRFFRIVWKLVFLGAVRSVLWVWLISRDRVPARISTSMYLMEFCILMGMLIVQMEDIRRSTQEAVPGRAAGIVKAGMENADGEVQKRQIFLRKQNFMPLLIGALYAFLGVAILPSAIQKTDADVISKAENNVRYHKLYAYLSGEENSENFYFIDVYSSVAYTEKMFENVDNSLDNYDIMGGWACKSPVWRKKLAAFGIENMEEALVSQPNVYYVQENGAETDWLVSYYADQGMTIALEPVEEPLEEFEIYKIAREAVGD